MPEGITCTKCGKPILDEERDAVNRKPCPNCGSTDRLRSGIINIATANLTIGAATINAQATLTPPPIDILLQTVVLRGDKVADGDLIVSVLPAWTKIIAMLERDPQAAFQIDARKWEEIIAGFYDEAGFDEVVLTPRSGDLGRDVIAVKHGLFTVRIIDQVKAFSPGRLVTANDVRALFGVLQADPKATKGLVTTTADFAPKVSSDPLISPFIPNRLELVNGKELISRLSAVANGERF